MGFDVRCDCWGADEETDLHVLLECPFTEEILVNTGLHVELANGHFTCVLEWVKRIFEEYKGEDIGHFAAVMWFVWNARIKLLFGKIDRN